MEVKTRLKVIMVERGISQTALSKKLGISMAALKSLVNGRSFPQLPLALKIADELGLKVEDIWILVKEDV
ncbi:helix-turn-helix transcriptional regulator [Gottfriedia acidiceleris]|uniref:helix-turn-helix transcriptional regulator n=1 Tax=Gottfriedia acidiceleris TaxID=371036 RepID=UPI00101B8460|nr:helix-turn-helix domain-containing protein [Gottfriedia acidiceleris]